MTPVSGWLVGAVGAIAAIAGPLIAIDAWRSVATGEDWLAQPALWVGVLVALAALIVLRGLFVVQPNHAVALTFFGSYRGTVRTNGLRWSLPVYRRHPVSLRLRTLDGDTLKVNDLDGNPVEISVVIAWAVDDTARALFGVEHFASFVQVQSEAAVRELANSFRYDSEDAEQVTLRGNSGQILDRLEDMLHHRLAEAGILVFEARLNHLAYAPEIANAMLRRQQAKAVIEARHAIVSGAVQIAQSAVRELQAADDLDIDSDARSQLIANLLVVLCSEHEVVPTLPTASA